MNSIITQKMKDQFLLLLPNWCNEIKTTIPLIDYEFSLATKWYAQQLPLLKKQNSAGQDYQVDVVKHLVADGLLTQKELTFKLTPLGVEKIEQLTAPPHKDNKHTYTNPQQNILNNVLSNGYVKTIICGVVVLFIWHVVLGN